MKSWKYVKDINQTKNEEKIDYGRRHGDSCRCSTRWYKKLLIPYVSVCKKDIMFSYMNLFKTVLIFFSVIAAVSCGTAGGDVEVSELDASELCRLQQADNPIRELYSMAVQNDSTVLLSTDREVLRYSFEGRRLKNLGNKGRAAGEYNMPMKVRVDGDRIFVWDAMNLKFMAV